MQDSVLALVASHVCYDGQCDFLFQCLRSLLRQTHRNVRVCVSVSFQNTTFRSEFERVVQERLPTVRFSLRTKQTYQMEHFRFLTHEHLADGHEYSMVCFCDDDDTYHASRIEFMLNAFRTMSTARPSESVYGVKELGTTRDYICDVQSNPNPEFWSYMIRPDVLVDFFRIMDGFDRAFLRNRFSDMIFRQYLGTYRKGGSKIVAFCTCEKCAYTHLYNHRYHDNSVCKRAPLTYIVRDGSQQMMLDVSSDYMSFMMLHCMAILSDIGHGYLSTRATLKGEYLERWDTVVAKMEDPSDPVGRRLRDMMRFVLQFGEM